MLEVFVLTPPPSLSLSFSFSFPSLSLSEAHRVLLEFFGLAVLLAETHPLSLDMSKPLLGWLYFSGRPPPQGLWNPLGWHNLMSPKMGPHTPSGRQAFEVRRVVSVDSGPCECNSVMDNERFQMIGLMHD